MTLFEFMFTALQHGFLEAAAFPEPLDGSTHSVVWVFFGLGLMDEVGC